ncbi:MAG: ParB/RepB/Spo0J family partition protein [Phycisphaeraceae bacterium]|nr:ParB/RepB/Spo0J family partition protein [Phycisphaeraceae bacterium]
MTQEDQGPRVQDLDIDSIVPNPNQPRDTFEQASIAELAESIKSAGLIQPIVVRPVESEDGRPRYELIAGERRLRAFRSLGRSRIPAIVRQVSTQESALLALIENIQRDDLNAAERAFGLRSIGEDFGLNHQQIADAVGLDRVTVTNLIRITELDGRSLDLVRHGKLSAGHARALLGIKDVATRSLLADTAIMEEWSVRTLEREVQRSSDRAESKSVSRGTSPAPIRSAHLSAMEDQLSRTLGTRVHLQLGRKKGAGRMTIEFHSLEQFDGILARLGVPSSAAL